MLAPPAPAREPTAAEAATPVSTPLPASFSPSRVQAVLLANGLRAGRMPRPRIEAPASPPHPPAAPYELKVLATAPPLASSTPAPRPRRLGESMAWFADVPLPSSQGAPGPAPQPAAAVALAASPSSAAPDPTSCILPLVMLASTANGEAKRPQPPQGTPARGHANIKDKQRRRPPPPGPVAARGTPQIAPRGRPPAARGC